MNDDTEIIKALYLLCAIGGGAYAMLTLIYMQSTRFVLLPWGLY